VSTGNNDPRSFMREGQGGGTTDASLIWKAFLCRKLLELGWARARWTMVPSSRKAFRSNLSIPVRARQVGPRRRTEEADRGGGPRRRTEGCLPLADRQPMSRGTDGSSPEPLAQSGLFLFSARKEGSTWPEGPAFHCSSWRRG
jgi:hypothetical protein